MQNYSLNEIIFASSFLLELIEVKTFKERNEIMVQDFPKNHLKEQIESEEMILKAKVLEVRSQVAKKIKKAQQESDKTYQKKLKEINEKKEEQISHIDSRFKEYVKEIEDSEERTFREITTKYEQREEEVINKLLKNILP
jgi:vacuolar-type H+-ATPase subunit H